MSLKMYFLHRNWDLSLTVLVTKVVSLSKDFTRRFLLWKSVTRQGNTKRHYMSATGHLSGKL
jgi:hypothetical protein